MTLVAVSLAMGLLSANAILPARPARRRADASSPD